MSDPLPILQALGGVAFILYGLWTATEAAHEGAGEMLRTNLVQWAKKRHRAAFAGLGLGSACQSSFTGSQSALHAVNSGLIDSGRSAWFGMGYLASSLTTAYVIAVMTGAHTMVAALALVSAGVTLRLAWPSKRVAAALLTGNGAMAWGIALLVQAFAHADRLPILSTNASPILWPIATILAGAGITMALRTPAATLAMSAACVYCGALTPIEGAGAWLGAHMATATPAVLSLRNGAQRTHPIAWIELAYLSATSFLGLIFLMLWFEPLARFLQSRFGASPVIALAAYQTILSVLGLGTAGALYRHIEAWLREDVGEEKATASQGLQHVDEHVLQIPALAGEALTRELQRTASIAISAAVDAVAGEGAGIASMQRAVDNSRATAAFTLRLQGLDLPPSTARILPEYLAAMRAYDRLTRASEELAHRPTGTAGLGDPGLISYVVSWQMSARAVLGAADPNSPGFCITAAREARSSLIQRQRELELRALRAEIEGRLPSSAVQELATFITTAGLLIEQAIDAAADVADIQSPERENLKRTATHWLFAPDSLVSPSKSEEEALQGFAEDEESTLLHFAADDPRR